MGDSRAEHDEDRNAEDSAAAADTTGEVGSEGGSHGEMEVTTDGGTGVGSEAGETWQPTSDGRHTILRDERGSGKRSP